MRLKQLYTVAFVGLLSCAIENDIPYPIEEASITAIEVEGQRGAETEEMEAATIDKKARTVVLYVNDSVDITRLKITKLQIDPRDALLKADSIVCDNYEKFPTGYFASLDSIPISSNTRIDFTEPVTFTLETYQEYPWKVTVNQIIQRDINVEGMTRQVLDANTRNVIIYVGNDQDLSNIQIRTLNLGGKYGTVEPDPTTVHDFTSGSQTFNVSRHGEDYSRKWQVFVYHDQSGSTASAGAFAMVTRATITGTIQSGKTPTVEYKPQSASSWSTVPASDVKTSGTSFTATVKGLTANTTYSYRVNVDGLAGEESNFTTAKAVPLTNGSMEEWSQEGKQWNPWKSGDPPFWGTGNKGAALVSTNITLPTDESLSGKAAYLGSKYVLVKFAAGNLFTGDFDLDGMNGILTLGRSFNSFPSALRVHLKYQSSTIAHVENPYTSLKGEADMCHIYIALSTDIVTIRTKNGDAFDKKGSSIIAYGEYISNKDVSGSERNGYKQVDIPLEYYKTDVTPKYIIIVCTASRYGDFFTGGEESKLWLDEMELLYE